MTKPNIPSEYDDMRYPVDDFELLPGNPRQGNVDAIAASYETFQQTKPIVAVEDAKGRKTVIAGNHQLQAARKLGWPEIAAIILPYTEDEAIAYALADNRLSDMGTEDEDLLYDMVNSVVDEMPEFFEILGWDDFEMSLMEPASDEDWIDTTEGPTQGWQPPELVSRDEDEEGEMHWSGDESAEKDLVTQGSTSAGISGAHAVVQYTLVFDTAQQQAKWYAFLRWMKARNELYPGETTSEQLIAFLEEKTGI